MSVRHLCTIFPFDISQVWLDNFSKNFQIFGNCLTGVRGWYWTKVFEKGTLGRKGQKNPIKFLVGHLKHIFCIANDNLNSSQQLKWLKIGFNLNYLKLIKLELLKIYLFIVLPCTVYWTVNIAKCAVCCGLEYFLSNI